MVVAYFFTALGASAERYLPTDAAALVFVGVIAAPLLETLALQALPVFIARLCKARLSYQILASLIPFTILHAVEGILVGLCAGLIGGFYFAFTYVHWREHSRWKAFWVTALSHAIHNALALTIGFLSGEL